MRRWEAARRAGAGATTTEVAGLAPEVALEALRFDYRWKKDRRFPWSPASVFDDGARVYVRLPASAEHAAGAVLFVTAPDGTSALLNYAVRGGTIITDRLFREAEFVYAEPGRKGKAKERRLRIWNTARR